MQTVYGLEDVYDLLEVAMVNAHNDRLMDEYQAAHRER